MIWWCTTRSTGRERTCEGHQGVHSLGRVDHIFVGQIIDTHRKSWSLPQTCSSPQINSDRNSDSMVTSDTFCAAVAQMRAEMTVHLISISSAMQNLSTHTLSAPKSYRTRDHMPKNWEKKHLQAWSDQGEMCWRESRVLTVSRTSTACKWNV